MRSLLAVLMTAIILMPVQVSGATGLFWDHARYDSDGVPIEGGVVGYGIDWNLTSNDGSSEQEFISHVESMPTIVEVYTATWCTNCVSTQNTLNEAIADSDAEIIHYHSYWYDTLDPFGNDSTEERWESKYGHASALRYTPRDAPTKVVDGERFHWGKVPKSESLLDDYSASVSRGSTAPLSGSITFTILQTQYSLMVGWNVSSISNHVTTGELSIEPWLLLVEESSYYPDGLNNLQNYEHVLLDAMPLESESEKHGTSNVSLPKLWDGDDLKIIMLLDWSVISTGGGATLLPAPGVLFVVSSLLVMAVVRPPRTH